MTVKWQYELNIAKLYDGSVGKKYDRKLDGYTDGSWKKTFLIAFIDDVSRVITHGQFFYRDNTENMIEAFRTALFKRGKPERLYFDNGANYTSKEILQACVRLNIHLSHAPVRDGAAKGKIERFFRGFRGGRLRIAF